ncbi:MAG: hypothetical protein ACYSU5_24145 [Planctomycetota bacterium]|jgi:hypothetical protein
MRKGHLLLLFMLVILTFVGCRTHVQVEAVSFCYEDEMVKKADFVVLADRRIFATMAFMNALGYDTEAQGKQMHPARLRLRRFLKDKVSEHPEQFRKWKKFYDKANLHNFHYQDFALSLTADYPFKRIRPDRELGYPYTAQRLADFPAVLNEFWKTCDLNTIWDQVKPIYLEEIHKYNFDRMEHQLTFLWDYLRMERSDRFVFITIPNLLEQHYNAIGAQYENYYYMVESPGAGSHALNLHEYLHSIINPMVKACYDFQREKLDRYYEAGKDQTLAATYRHNVTYAFECLVRALDKRLCVLLADTPSTSRRCEQRVLDLTQDGLTLVHPFYRLLEQYEQGKSNFAQFLPEMLNMLPEYSD